MVKSYILLLITVLILQGCTNKNEAKQSGNNSKKATTTAINTGSTQTVSAALPLAEDDEATTTNINTTSRGDEELNRMYKEGAAGKAALDKRKKNTTKASGRASSTYGFYPEGSQRKLTDTDIKLLSPWGHKIMLNEIYARHGMIFADDVLKHHFKRQKWYKPISKNVYQNLSVIEKQNITFLINTEPKPAK